jgi:DNA-binding NarL/FixJ family response regulator
MVAPREEWCVSPPTLNRPRLVLADDHVETAEQLHELLRPYFDVVALVEDGRALVSAASRLAPDVIVTDISMPGLDGIEASIFIRRHNPDARIVLVTAHAEPILVERGLAAGALGYVLKDAAGDELVPAILSALAGNRYVGRTLSLSPDPTGRRSP